MKLALVVAGLLLLPAIAAPVTKVDYKVTRLSVSQVGVSCLNGGDPTVRKVGDLLIVSCGYSPDTILK